MTAAGHIEEASVTNSNNMMHQSCSVDLLRFHVENICELLRSKPINENDTEEMDKH